MTFLVYGLRFLRYTTFMFIWDLSQVLVQVRALFGNAIFVQLMASSSVALESILLF